MVKILPCAGGLFLVTCQFRCQVKVWGLEMLNSTAIKSKILEDVKTWHLVQDNDIDINRSYQTVKNPTKWLSNSRILIISVAPYWVLHLSFAHIKHVRSMQYNTKPFITSMGLSQYQIGRLIMLFANSRFIWPSRIALLMQLLHFPFKTLHVPKNRAGLSSLCHQKARADKGQHCPHKALLVATLTEAPHFGKVFGKTLEKHAGKHQSEMLSAFQTFLLLENPNMSSSWEVTHPLQTFFPWILPHIFTFFCRWKETQSLLYLSVSPKYISRCRASEAAPCSSKENRKPKHEANYLINTLWFN